MENTPKVSVIIPCYNQGKYIDDAVNSILNQTFQDFEIIIVNDGSTDRKTNKILAEYDKPKTQVIHTRNQGTPLARNTAIANAKGEYILPLDADDKIAETYLEKAVNILDSDEDIGIVACNVKYFGKPAILFYKLPRYKFPDILVFNSFMNSSFFRKSDWEKVGGYKENMRQGWEDHDFWLSIIGLNRKIHKIPEKLLYYHIHFSFLSRHNSLTDEQREDLYLNMFENHKEMYVDNIDVLFKYIVKLRATINKRNRFIKTMFAVIAIIIMALIYYFLF